MRMRNLLAAIGLLSLLGVVFSAGIVSSHPSWWTVVGWPGTPTPAAQVSISTTAVIQKVQQLSQLITTKYTIQVVVGRGREGTIFGIGKDKILLVAQGKVIAGLDLSQLKEQDVHVTKDHKQITVNLPPLKLFDTYLVEGNTFVYQRDTGVFSSIDPNLETEARRQALSDITKAACDDGIMNEASDNAKKAVTELLRTIDFQEVTVNINTNSQCVLLSN